MTAELLGSITVPALCLGSSRSPDWLRTGAEASALTAVNTMVA